MNSIRRHLVAGLIGGATVALGLTGVGLYLAARTFLVREFDAALRSKALALVTLTEKQHNGVELNFADEFMPEFERRDRPDYFQMWLADGSTLERSRSLRNGDLPRQSGTVTTPAFWDLTLPDGRAGRAVGIEFEPHWDDRDPARPSEPAAASGATVTLVATRERTGLNQTLAMLRAALALGGGLLLAALGILVTVVVRRATAPLAVVGERAVSIDAASLQTRFPVDTLPVELRPICDRLNDLLERLEHAFERERRISSDISHELRTPLAELRARAEVALKWHDDSAGAAATLGQVLAITRRMETLVTGLLAVARSEAGRMTIQRAPVDVGALVREAWSSVTADAGRRGVRLRVELPGDWRVSSDAALLRLVIVNLISNAVEYSPEGGQVCVHATTSAEQFALSVDNTTTDLAADDLPRVFERFWRKDGARSGDRHVGLGLTLAQQVATVLGLKISAEMLASSTVRFSLRGPTGPVS